MCGNQPHGPAIVRCLCQTVKVNSERRGCVYLPLHQCRWDDKRLPEPVFFETGPCNARARGRRPHFPHICGKGRGFQDLRDGPGHFFRPAVVILIAFIAAARVAAVRTPAPSPHPCDHTLHLAGRLCERISYQR